MQGENQRAGASKPSAASVTLEGAPKKDQTLSDLLYMSVGTNFSRVVLSLSGLLISRFLGVFLSGVYRLLNMIYAYSEYVHAPLRTTLAREVPYRQGIGETKKAEELMNATYSVAVGLGLFISLGIFVASFLVSGGYAVRLGLRVFSIVAFMMALSNHLVVFYRTRKRFYDLSIYFILNGVLLAVTTVVLSYFFKFEGLLVGLVVSYAISLMFMLRRKRYTFKMQANLPVLKLIFTRGTPLVVCGYVISNLRQIDRLMVVSLLGIDSLAYYGIAVQVCDMLYMIPATIWSVIFPSFLQRSAAQKNNLPALKNEVVYNATTTAAVTPITFLWAALTIPWLVHLVLPDFAPGIVVTQILIIGTYYLSLYEMFYYVLMVAERLRYVVITGLIMLALAIGSMWGAVRLGYGINGIAIAASLWLSLFTIVISSLSSRLMRMTFGEYLRAQWHMLFPAAYGAGCFFLAIALTPGFGAGAAPETLQLVIRLAIGTVAYLPMLIWIDRKTTILRRAAREASEKVRNLLRARRAGTRLP